ncbi:endonuclease/exonuclease/phosphatase family protein [Pasteurellaceae bacterium LIM206]|nr:endonuclease/exonuclease/phosphatase family protein [Pasteurellaceae bacterium LIM206]
MKRFLCLIAGIVLAVSLYLYSTLQIFTQPRITFITPENPSLKQISPFCFRTENTVTPLSQRKFNVLVWNIHKGEDAGWLSALADYSAQADFVLLQESTNRQQIAKQFSADFNTALHVTAFAYKGMESGVEMLAKSQPDKICAGIEKEPWILIPKVGESMQFPLTGGGSLLVVNLHLVNFEFHPTSYRRQLEKVFSVIAQHTGPIILAGDFNSWRAARLELLDQLARTYGLQEVRFQPDYRLQFLAHPLDHAFVRGLKVNQATTVKTASSDHNPLLLELELEDH